MQHDITTLLARIAQIEAELEAAHTDKVYGCLTRVGLDRAWERRANDNLEVVFGDLDHMHELNAELGYDEVDRRIRAALAGLRIRHTDLLAGRWYSGDELVFVLAGDACGFAQRLHQSFAEQGIGITIGYGGVLTPVLSDTVTHCSAKVQLAKSQGRRGSIN